MLGSAMFTHPPNNNSNNSNEPEPEPYIRRSIAYVYIM